MNEELQKQISDILKHALEAAQKGGEWIGGQLPDVLHQLIVWTIVKGSLAALVPIAYAITLIVLIPRQWKWVSDDKEWGSRELSWMATGAAALFAMIPVSFCIGQVMDGLQAIFAPKLFLLEYAAHLMK